MFKVMNEGNENNSCYVNTAIDLSTYNPSSNVIILCRLLFFVRQSRAQDTSARASSPPRISLTYIVAPEDPGQHDSRRQLKCVTC